MLSMLTSSLKWGGWGDGNRANLFLCETLGVTPREDESKMTHQKKKGGK